MTRKHYEAIARTLFETMPSTVDEERWDTWNDVCIAMARTLKDLNESFNTARFLHACKGHT